MIANVSQYTDDVLSKDERDRLIGQAYFLRGLAYFDLANEFKNGACYYKASVGQSDYYAPTATEDELWSQIYSDFQNAESMLPISYDNVTGPDKGQKGRATKGAAAGLLGKAYLYRKDWTKAATQFEKFLNGPLKNVYSLMPDYRDNFKDANENNAESLFEIQFKEGEGTDFNWTGEPSSAWKQVQAFR